VQPRLTRGLTDVVRGQDRNVALQHRRQVAEETSDIAGKANLQFVEGIGIFEFVQLVDQAGSFILVVIGDDEIEGDGNAFGTQLVGRCREARDPVGDDAVGEGVEGCAVRIEPVCGFR
jgi:hypothetical protein